MNVNKKKTVILIEDDPDVCQNLVNVITGVDQFDLLYTGPSVKDGIIALKKFKPDILLTDLSLIDGSGIDIISAITTEGLNTDSIVITGFQDEHIVFSALKAGAKGYILKGDQSQTIIESINSMLDGGAPISPIIARLLIKQFDETPEGPNAPEILTKQQKVILKYISQGFSSKEIAEKLNISYYTVTTHIKNIYSKLQVNSRTEALHQAFQLGLMDKP